MKEFRYKAFISYSHADRDWAAWLLASLESYRMPRHLVGRKTDLGIVPARLTPIFRDRDELPAAQRLTDRLFEALRASEFLIVLCSPAAVKSKMVNREIAEFKKHRGEGYILYMIVGGKPFSDDPDTECFPPAVLKAIQPDGSTRGFSPEGLAADVRQDGDGKRMGLIKIVAGMIGVGLNDIVRREERRRQGQTVGIVTTAGIAVAVMSGLLYEATEARKAAVQSQSEAETRQTALQQELAFNKDLTDFLIHDVYRRMLEVGDMETLELINTKLIETFEDKGIIFRNEDQFFRYTGTSLRHGQMLDRKGESEKARKIFERTLAISERYYADHPNTVLALRRIQNTHFFLAYLAMRQGRFEEADRLFRKQIELIEQGTKTHETLIQPVNSRIVNPSSWIGQGSEARTTYGRLLSGPLGEPEKAIGTLLWAVKGFSSQLKTHSMPNRIRVSLSGAYHSLGNAYLYAGQIGEAEKAYQNRFKLLAGIYENDKNNTLVRRRLMITNQSFATIALSHGQQDKAVKLLQKSVEGFDTLIAYDKANTMWLADSAQAYLELAEAAWLTDAKELSKSALKTSREQITEALRRDNTRLKRHLTKYRCMLLAAKHAIASGADRAAQDLLQTLTAEFAAKDQSIMRANGYILTAAESYYLLSRILETQQRSQASKEAIETAIRLIETSKATRTMELKDLLARLYARVGRKDDEALLITELEGYGYKRLPDRAYSHPVAAALTDM